MPEPSRRIRDAPLVLCAALALLFLARQLRDGLDFLSFADEAAHLVGGRVLASGGILYRDFIDSHGPLVFAVAQGYGAVFGWAHNETVRGLLAIAAIAATASLAASPLARGRNARAGGILVGAGLLGLVWLRQGLFLFSFYPLGGALAAIALAGFVAGAAFGRWPGRAHALVAGLATGSLAAVAYSFWPSVCCFVASAFWAAPAARERRSPVWFGAGLLLAGCLLTAWMLRFADLHGFLSYHLAESQTVYARHLRFGWRTFALGMLPSLRPEDRAQTIGMLCWIVALLASCLPGTRRGPWLLVVLGVLLLNARGARNFQDGTFLWASIALSALAVMRAVALLPARWSHAGGAGCVLLVLGSAAFLRPAPFLPFGLDGRTIAAMPRWPIGDRASGDLFDRIRHYAHPDEPILALLYQPQLYLLADRLPMPGFYAWFPWDQEYVGRSRFGRGRDLCRALRERPPPVIVVDPAPFWGRTPSEVVPCLSAILRDRYRRDIGTRDIHGRLFVRSDVIDRPTR